MSRHGCFHEFPSDCFIPFPSGAASSADRECALCSHLLDAARAAFAAAGWAAAASALPAALPPPPPPPPEPEPEIAAGGTAGCAAAPLAPCWGPHLHRWGGAFPLPGSAAPPGASGAPGSSSLGSSSLGGGFLGADDSFLPAARIAFCGDFCSTVTAPTPPPAAAADAGEGSALVPERAGTVEGALLSGASAAARLFEFAVAAEFGAGAKEGRTPLGSTAAAIPAGRL